MWYFFCQGWGLSRQQNRRLSPRQLPPQTRGKDRQINRYCFFAASFSCFSLIVLVAQSAQRGDLLQCWRQQMSSPCCCCYPLTLRRAFFVMDHLIRGVFRITLAYILFPYFGLPWTRTFVCKWKLCFNLYSCVLFIVLLQLISIAGVAFELPIAPFRSTFTACWTKPLMKISLIGLQQEINFRISDTRWLAAERATTWSFTKLLNCQRCVGLSCEPEIRCSKESMSWPLHYSYTYARFVWAWHQFVQKESYWLSCVAWTFFNENVLKPLVNRLVQTAFFWNWFLLS